MICIIDIQSACAIWNELIKNAHDHEQNNLKSYDCDEVATRKLFHIICSLFQFFNVCNKVHLKQLKKQWKHLKTSVNWDEPIKEAWP
jgi:hypothetical protein